MKSILLYTFLVLGALISFGADTPIEINLLDGSRIKGRVMSATASEITFMTDFGVSRIPLERLTPESKQAVTQGAKPDVDALLRRVAEGCGGLRSWRPRCLSSNRKMNPCAGKL